MSPECRNDVTFTGVTTCDMILTLGGFVVPKTTQCLPLAHDPNRCRPVRPGRLTTNGRTCRTILADAGACGVKNSANPSPRDALVQIVRRDPQGFAALLILPVVLGTLCTGRATTVSPVAASRPGVRFERTPGRPHKMGVQP